MTFTTDVRIVNLNLGREEEQMTHRMFLSIAVLGLLTLSGCSSSEPSAAQQAALAKTEAPFDINKCEQNEPGFLKSPAPNKPICNPDYNGQAECVRIGPK